LKRQDWWRSNLKGFNRFGNMMPPEECFKRPYLLDRRPFRIADNLYYVGNAWCSSHLINTGEGLILLDTPCASGLPGLINNIWELGFSPDDLQYIIVSHAHTDHFGAVRALAHMTQAKTFLSAVDAQDMRENPERMEAMNTAIGCYNECFLPDIELKDGDVVELGSVHIRCVLTPGHTVGAMSHFWAMDHAGKEYGIGIYGGAGFISLSKAALEKNKQPLSLQTVFLESIDKVWDEKVDLMLGNHPFHNDTYQKYQLMREGNSSAFIDPAEWRRFLQELKDRYKNFLELTQEEIDFMYQNSQWNNYYNQRRQ
jgi:metallo-beta-lactamase class B